MSIEEKIEEIIKTKNASITLKNIMVAVQNSSASIEEIIDAMQNRNQRLIDELLAMRQIGIVVSDQTIQKASEVDLSEYSGIMIEELASLFCELYN